MKKILKFVAFSAILLMLVGSFFSCGDDTNEECTEEMTWSLRFKLKPQADENYLATEDSEILDLVAKHDIIRFYQTYQGFQTPELLLYYTLTGKWCNKENKEKVIDDFLATGKFEDEVYDYGTAHS